MSEYGSLTTKPGEGHMTDPPLPDTSIYGADAGDAADLNGMAP